MDHSTHSGMMGRKRKCVKRSMYDFGSGAIFNASTCTGNSADRFSAESVVSAAAALQKSVRCPTPWNSPATRPPNPPPYPRCALGLQSVYQVLATVAAAGGWQLSRWA